MHRDERIYIDDILAAIQRIEPYVKGMDYARFAGDDKTCGTVVRNNDAIVWDIITNKLGLLKSICLALQRG
jgi:hypothetical protein